MLSILISSILALWSMKAHGFLLTYSFGNAHLLLLSPGEITPSWLDEFQQHTLAHKPHMHMLTVNFNYKHMAVSSKHQHSLKWTPSIDTQTQQMSMLYCRKCFSKPNKSILKGTRESVIGYLRNTKISVSFTGLWPLWRSATIYRACVHIIPYLW